MEKRLCGNSVSFPILGIGCWSFGGGDYWGAQDQHDVDEVVNRALDCGVNYFDTAEAYNEGRSEESLGKALGSRRPQALIGTKVPPAYASPSLIREHCEASLRRLGTDYIDLYMIHWPIIDFPQDAAFETLNALQAEGKIRASGLSNFGVEQMRQAAANGSRAIANQLCYNLLSRAIEFAIMPECEHQGLGILAYMPLQQGLLSAKYASADDLPAVRARTRHFRGDRPLSRHGEAGAEVEVFAALAAVQDLARSLNVPVSTLAMAWLASKRQVTSIILGIRTTAQLEEAVRGVDFGLSSEAAAQLDEITRPVKEILGSNADYFLGSADSRIR